MSEAEAFPVELGGAETRPSKPLRANGALDLEYVINAAMALVMLIFFAPIMALVALAVKLQDGGPIFFGHQRIGRFGRPFYCLKFRIMATDAQARLEQLLANDPEARKEWELDHKLKNDPRITPIGQFLRKSSLDELPQLINVLRGEMSLVGPRPVVQAEALRYGRRFQDYCSVRPGITGLWQVSGRNDVGYRRRVAFDVVYARSKSLPFDMVILMKTVPAVLMRKGSY